MSFLRSTMFLVSVSSQLWCQASDQAMTYFSSAEKFKQRRNQHSSHITNLQRRRTIPLERFSQRRTRNTKRGQSPLSKRWTLCQTPWAGVSTKERPPAILTQTWRLGFFKCRARLVAGRDRRIVRCLPRFRIVCSVVRILFMQIKLFGLVVDIVVKCWWKFKWGLRWMDRQKIMTIGAPE